MRILQQKPQMQKLHTLTILTYYGHYQSYFLTVILTLRFYKAAIPAMWIHSRQLKNDTVSTDKLPSVPYKFSVHCPQQYNSINIFIKTVLKFYKNDDHL